MASDNKKTHEDESALSIKEWAEEFKCKESSIRNLFKKITESSVIENEGEIQYEKLPTGHTKATAKYKNKEWLQECIDTLYVNPTWKSAYETASTKIHTAGTRLIKCVKSILENWDPIAETYNGVKWDQDFEFPIKNGNIFGVVSTSGFYISQDEESLKWIMDEYNTNHSKRPNDLLTLRDDNREISNKTHADVEHLLNVITGNNSELLKSLSKLYNHSGNVRGKHIKRGKIKEYPQGIVCMLGVSQKSITMLQDPECTIDWSDSRWESLKWFCDKSKDKFYIRKLLDNVPEKDKKEYSFVTSNKLTHVYHGEPYYRILPEIKSLYKQYKDDEDLQKRWSEEFPDEDEFCIRFGQKSGKGNSKLVTYHLSTRPEFIKWVAKETGLNIKRDAPTEYQIGNDNLMRRPGRKKQQIAESTYG